MIQNRLQAERRRILGKIVDELESVGCAGLLGEHQMGKSSILLTLEESLSSPRVYVSLAELTGCSAGQAEQLFYQKLLRGLARTGATNRQGDSQSVGEGQQQFERRLEELANRRMTLLIDDAERLADFGWGHGFFHKLSVAISFYRNLRVVLSGTRKLKSWAERMAGRNGKAGAWELIREPIVLEPLPASNVLDACGGNEVIGRRLVELCGGHPFCLSELTECGDRRDEPQNVQLEALEQQAIGLRSKWEPVFARCWTEFDVVSRQICFFLATGSEDVAKGLLETYLEKATRDDLERSLTHMKSCGVLVEDVDGNFRLIDLFRDWYRVEVGWIARWKEDRSSSEDAALRTLELSFLEDQNTVLVRRRRYVYSTDFGLLAEDRAEIVRRTRDIPKDDGEKFFSNILGVSRLLWRKLNRTRWYKEVEMATDLDYRLRFNVPVEMGEFPLELLPLDESGSDRIGLKVPISRRIFKQGRSIDRLPLQLRMNLERRLKVLVVAAQVSGDIHIDKDGKVSPAEKVPPSTDGDLYELDAVDLTAELEDLGAILTERSDYIESVTFLTRAAEITSASAAVRLLRKPDTAAAFEEVLKARNDYDIIHFVGHGLVSGDSMMQSGLLFSDGLVHLTKLSLILRSQANLRFVYLSCCQSAELSANEKDNDLLGLAHACVQAGVPSVLGMRWGITVGASHRLTNNFYPALFRTGQVDRALHLASREVFAKAFDLARKAYSAAPILVQH